MKKREEAEIKVPAAGALGLLALGHAGVDLWRKAIAENSENTRNDTEEKVEKNNDKGDE
ncbi:MAG: hypothetical protein ACI9J3_000070 [Parvicellaceae bacterium]|jgi:hypothetical protein